MHHNNSTLTEPTMIYLKQINSAYLYLKSLTQRCTWLEHLIVKHPWMEWLNLSMPFTVHVTWFSVHTSISYHFLVCMCVKFVEGGVVCVRSLLLENSTLFCSFPFWICFYNSCAFVDHQVHERIVHWVHCYRYPTSASFHSFQFRLTANVW